jgi:integrase
VQHVTVRARVFKDSHGVYAEIPVILTEYGELRPLVEYMLEHVHKKSASWMQKLAQAVGLLLDYMSTNQEHFDQPEDLFKAFVARLYTGTANNDGIDPGGLYWMGMNTPLIRQLTGQLSDFSDWIGEKQQTKPLNPWREATKGEELLAWAAWEKRRKHSILSHAVNYDTAALQNKRARQTLVKKSPPVDRGAVKHFSDDRIEELLFKGFIVPGNQNSPRLEERLNLRGILITMLMDFGGLRESEPFHLYAHDVLPDPFHPERAYVRIFHPEEGLAPDDWRDARGKPIHCNRAAYLMGKYGMRPRNLYSKTVGMHAGWKGNVVEANGKFMPIFWFPQWTGELFQKLWVFYMAQRSRLRCDHPFAFVTEKGDPYAIKDFFEQHERAVERIGLIPAKMLGTSPHGHRHAYGQRLTDAEIDPLVRKKALHHKSLASQDVYTVPDMLKVNRMLDAATQRIESGTSLPAPDFTTYGFKDVDPLRNFTYIKPKIRSL